ncbi:MAG: S8 family peptidase, partial [Planctomycetota bacterium]
PFDDHYHGTHCSGTIGGIGNNGAGVAGVNWNVRLMALKFLNSGGSGYLADAVSAIDYSRVKGVHLTSNSWGGGGYSIALKSAIEAAGAAGQLFIAAAGNSGLNADISPMYPAAYDSPTIVSVAATDHSDLRAYFTNYGAVSVDLAAPGVNVYSARPGNTYQFLSGTSMATPHVSGVAALVLSLRTSMPPLELKQVLLGSVDPIPAMAGRCVTGGRLNAHRALLMADPAPWLSLTPISGTLFPGQSVLIDVTANAAGLAQGSTHSALIRFTSGDAVGPLDVSVNLMVLPCATDADCNDGLACNGAEICGISGACQAGTPVDCNDGVACTADACNEPSGTCTHTPNNSLCDNGLVCDGAETCDPTLGCQGGTPLVCPDDGVACTIDQCDETLAGCDHVPNDAACDNGVFCDGIEWCDFLLGCQPGYCGTPCFGQPCDEATDSCLYCTVDADCNDGIACTQDTCDVASGFCNIVGDDLACDDGLFCNGFEYCDYCLGCQFWYDPCAGLPCDEATDSCGGCLSDADCDDFVTCTVDTCNTVTNFCQHVPDHTVCDNGLFCDGVETCHALLDCQFGTPVNCEDGLVCTIDACIDATASCEHVPDDASCDNGLFCDGQETCDPVLDCQVGIPVDCNDGVTCTTDSCNEATLACDYSPDDTVCDNGVFCDGAEICDAVLDCQPGVPVDCDDGVVCTVDTCNEAFAGCDNTPDDAVCNDGLFCNGEETCNVVLGCQPGTDPCAQGACDEATDSCIVGPEVWMTFAAATTVPGLGIVENEDIVSYNQGSGTWSLMVDGSDVGLTALAIDGFTVLADGSILLTFADPGTISGLTGGPTATTIDDSDIVRFIPSSLGATTAGSFVFYFDGSDVGLTAVAEDVDGIGMNAAGQLVLSTLGSFSVAGLSGNGADLIVFTPTSLGSATSGSYTMLFDGSDVGLSAVLAENVDAAGFMASGALLLSTTGNFAVPGLTGSNQNIFRFNSTTFGSTTSGTFSMFLNLDTAGIALGANVVALEILE